VLLGWIHCEDKAMSEERKQDNPYDALCPACGTPAVQRCRCPTGDFTCSNGHQWYRCPVHKTPMLGSGHGASFMGKCSCGVGSPREKAIR